MNILLIIALSYLLGSIPFGYLIGKLYKKDITKVGSGNIGATNTFRVLGPIPGVTAFLLDFFKGTVPVILAQTLFANSYIPIATGTAAILGHTFSLFMRFKGGKGVAVGLGVLLGLAPKVFLICAIWAALVIYLTKYVSLASVTGSILATVLMFAFQKPLPYSFFVLAANILILVKHKDNIKRLIKGEENKIEKK